MAADDDELRQAVAQALEQALGEPALLVAGWREPHAIRLIYAFPSLRLATLAHWRDEVEFTFEGAPVVAFEASKWARLLLKSHGGTLLCSARPPAWDPHGLVESFCTLAASLWNDDATAWAHARGVPPLASQSGQPLANLSGQPLANPTTPQPSRFDAINGWLIRVRAVADRTFTPNL